MTTGQLAEIRAAEKAATDKVAADRASRAAALARAALQKRGAPAFERQQEPIELADTPGEMVMVMNGNEQHVPDLAPPEPEPPAAEPSAEVPGSLFERVLVCEDTALLREIVKDALVQSGISQHVRTCGNGEEFLITVGEALAAGVPIDLAILDVEMPILNGYQTAIALRAFERGLKTQPTPLVFFTSYACDETFKRVLEHCQPARYLNKGADSAPPRIAARLVQVLGSLKR
jgi:CheY-like chemotaxis protein